MNPISSSSCRKKVTLSLQIRGVGHIKSLKNKKRIVSGKRIMMDKKMREQIKALNVVIECRLAFVFQTEVGAMQTGLSLQSWTLSSLPLDDSLDWIPQGRWETIRVPKGEEGADILIEEL